jgi:polyisoprenoid-binding protein YceI
MNQGKWIGSTPMTAPNRTNRIYSLPAWRTAILVLMCAGLVCPCFGQEPISTPKTYILQGESRLWFEGDSTLHRFKVDATKLDGVLSNVATEYSITSAKISIPVRDLKSGKAGLDQNMMKALNSDAFPEITFVSTAIHGNDRQVTVSGTLTVSGQARPIKVSADIANTADEISATGNVSIKMSEYGITPPTMFWGRVKTKDEVRVRFVLKFKEIN